MLIWFNNDVKSIYQVMIDFFLFHSYKIQFPILNLI